MSIELPDGKVCRSLPEQVAENAKNIKIILEILDGLNIQNNLVVIADISQILTRSELDIVERPVAFLYYGDQLYIKKNEVGGSAFFDVIFSISGSTVISFASKEIEVNLSTGALSLTTSTVSTYSKSELDTLLSAKSDITYVDAQLAGKADLSGANFTGDITANSIIENMSGYSISLGTNANYTYEKIYCGVVKNGNKLTIVLAINFTKDDASAASNPTLAIINLPSGVASKLFNTNIGGYNLLDVKENFLWSSINSNVSAKMWMSKESNSIRCAFTSTGNMVVGTKYYVRYETTFLLSDTY